MTDVLAEYARLESERNELEAEAHRLKVVALSDRAEIERLRNQLEDARHLADCRARERDELKLALQQAALCLRLGRTWVLDADRHRQMQAAWESVEAAMKACDESL